MSASHTITKSIVRGKGPAVLRARCSCDGFEAHAARLSAAARRKQDRLIREHLSSAVDGGPAAAAALLVRSAIESPL